MLKLFFLLSFALINLGSSAQSYVYIERNEANSEIFDDEISYGLMKLLKSNINALNYYDLKGISPAVLSRIRSKKLDESVLNFVGPDNSVIPLVDENGEEIIIELEDGTLSFVYPAPDSVFVDLEGITGILLELNSTSRSNKELYERIHKIHFTKQYEGDELSEIVCSLNGEALLQFDAFKVLTKMDVPSTNELIGEAGDSKLLNYLKERSLLEMKGKESGETVSGYEIRSSGRIVFFAGEYWPCSSWNSMNLRHPRIMYERQEAEETFLYLENYDCEENLPFGSYYDDLDESTEENHQFISAQFDACFTLWIQSDVPLVNEYGDQLIVTNDDGMDSYVYSAPRPEYFWVDSRDYEIYTIQDFKYDSTENQTISSVERLIFTKKMGSSEGSKVVFHIDLIDNKDILKFLPSSASTVLQETPWWIQITSEIDRRKNRIRSSSKCKMKKLKQRVNIESLQ